MFRGTIKVMAVLITGSLICGCSLIEGPLTSRISVTEPVSRPYAVTPQTIMVEDLTISYQEGGDGPWVVLIHGGVIPLSSIQGLGRFPVLTQQVLHAGAVATSDCWNANLEALSQNFHVVALDLPGFGGSDKPDIDYTLEEFVIYLEAFMQAKGIDRAMLVGHGLGGEIAIAYALEHPEMVDKLVLVNSFGAWGADKPNMAHSPLNLSFPVKYWQKEKAAQINIFLPLYRKMLGGWTMPAERAVASTLNEKISGAYPENLVLSREGESGKFIESVAAYKLSYITTEESRKEVHALHQALLQTRRKDLQKRFGEVKAPVLIVQGIHDSAVKVEEAQFMENSFPMSQLILYEKSGHYPMVEEAQRFNQDVGFFLSATGITARTDQ